MRTLFRNMQEFHYSNYVSKTEITDEWGNLTGEYELTFSEPASALGNISAAKGDEDTEQFGQNLDYDKVIAMDELPEGFTESTRLWIDTTPTAPHDYIVKRIGRSLNSVLIAVKRVQVNG